MSTIRVNTILDAAGGNSATINGYVPVEQGGGTDMSNTNVKIGWRTDGQGLALQVGATPLGTVVRNVATPTGLNQQLSAPGAAPIYACRAWVNFNGTGTVAIRASGNVSSITDNGVGNYTVNFTTAMQDANYSVSCMCFSVGGSPTVSPTSPETINQLASSVQIYCKYGSATADPTTVTVAIFR